MTTQHILRNDRKIRNVMCDVLNTDNSSFTSCIALYIMALCPGLSSVSIVLQHRQWASSLISGHWRCLSTAGERPECNGLSLHSCPMVSCQRVREKHSGKRAAKIQQKYFQNVYLHSCPLISWIIFGKPEESVKTVTSWHLKQSRHLKIYYL